MDKGGAIVDAALRERCVVDPRAGHHTAWDAVLPILENGILAGKDVHKKHRSERTPFHLCAFPADDWVRCAITIKEGYLQVGPLSLVKAVGGHCG